VDTPDEGASRRCATVQITDMVGRTVDVPEGVDAVVGIGAGALRLITYLDACGKVVGVEQSEKDEGSLNKPYILAHPGYGDLPSIGPSHGGDAELIAAQKPDVIFWTYAETGEASDLQEKTGVPVIALRYGGPNTGEERETFYEALTLMGRVLGREDRAEDLIRYMEDAIEDLTHRTEDIPEECKPTVYVGAVGHRGTHGIVSTEPAYAPFRFVNARNVAAGLGLEHAMVSREKIVDWDPDVLFVDEGGYSLAVQDLRRAEYRSLAAIGSGEVYGVLPFNYYTHNYATILADAYYVGKVLYPDRFEDVDPEEKVDEIYERFVGEPVYGRMMAIFGGFKKLDL